MPTPGLSSRLMRFVILEAKSIIRYCMPYFDFTAASADANAAPVTTTSVPVTDVAPSVTFPRVFEGTSSTADVLLIRLTFQAMVSVVNPTVPSPRSAIHTGVSLRRPSFVKVVSRTYFSAAIAVMVATVAWQTWVSPM